MTSRKILTHFLKVISEDDLPSEQPQFVAWTRQGVESLPQGCSPMLTPMLPTVVSSWLDVIWVVNRSLFTQETVEREKLSSVAVLEKPVCLAPTTIPHSKAFKSFVLPIHPKNGTHIQSMSQALKIII